MTFEAYVHGFGCVPTPTPYEKARAVVVPVPLELGSGEVPGLGLGPMAVLGASRFVETYEVELGFDPLELGVATLDAVRLRYDRPDRPYEQIRDVVKKVLDDGKLPLCIGGERTIVLAAARACAATHGDVGVVAFTRRPGFCLDADGRHVAPETIGRRLSEELPCCLLGPRFWSAGEAAFMSGDGAPPVVTARQITKDESLPTSCLSHLPHRVYLSIDVGVLDPAVLPIAGNIEPGGLGWFTLTSMIDEICREFSVVGCDVSGFAPVLGDLAPSVLVADLTLRCLGRILTSGRPEA